jgi:hypothetical protein
VRRRFWTADSFVLRTAQTNKVDSLITITAFSVGVPFAVGVYHRRRVPYELVPIVLLCGVWLLAEILSYYLRAKGQHNAFVSYFLTPLEVFLFTTFFFRIGTINFRNNEIIGWTITAGAVMISGFEYIFVHGELNAISLACEFGLITFLSVHTYLRSSQYPLLILTLLFYTLTSFPYFFAFDWLRANNLSVLMLLASIYAYTHTCCYLLIAIILWKKSTSSAVRS